MRSPSFLDRLPAGGSNLEANDLNWLGTSLHGLAGCSSKLSAQEAGSAALPRRTPEADIDRLWEQLPNWSIRSDINRGCVMIIGPVNVSQRVTVRANNDGRATIEVNNHHQDEPEPLFNCLY